MTDGMFFEQGYWTANQSFRRRLFFMGSALLWLAIPIADLANQDPSGLEIAGAVVGMVAFAIVFLDAAWRPVTHEDIRRVLVRTGLALALAIAMTLTLVPSFALMFVLAAVGAGIRLPPRLGVPAVLATTVLAVVASALGGATDGQVGSWGVTTLAMGILFVAFGRLIVANLELRAARAELAQRAVAEERERFSRDLHDLLGHSLSVIALKAELADRTLPDHPERAEREVRQIQSVAREALAEVRQTVSGYRLPTLEGELAGARMALEAAGIEADLASERIALPPEAEAVLAWTVREGTTNVIRHSNARHASIRILPGLVAASAEVVDDGRGANGGPPDGGHGLAGLRERAERLGGEVEAGTGAAGGFRLRVSVPV
jgi:two-component system, NarL family, sensor histidine kinase DesK